MICGPLLLRQAVDKLCAAADELRVCFAGHFVLACRITKGGGGGGSANLATKASLSRLEYESRAEEKTDGDEIVKLSGKAYPPFTISKALFCCFQDVNYLLGSAARGRSSCNNTEHADNKVFMAQFLQWNGNFFFFFFW